MNSHKINMYVGAIIGSVLVFLLLGFFSDLIFVGRGHPEHEPLAFAVEIEGEGEETVVETVVEPVTEAVEAVTETATETVTAITEAVQEATGEGDFADLLAVADAEAGAKVFKKCKACHKLEEGKKAVGPSLWGVIGRDIASTEGFKYSDAIKGVEGNWTLANLDAFLTKPKAFAPGNKMTFPGLKKAQDRINVITYLNEADGSPEPLQ